jgi:diacylglycerol kinase family enzyme
MTEQDVTTRGPAEVVPVSARWLARGAVLAMAAAAAVLLIGDVRSLVVALTALASIAVCLAGAWWFVSRHGPARWLGAALMVAAPGTVLIWYIARSVLWAVMLVVALVAVSVALGRAALTKLHPPQLTPEHQAAPVRRPYLVMNPRSGGGKVGRFDLVAKSRALGAQVDLLDGPRQVDVEALAKQAVADGYDLLGVAGGDGTQALVAGIAATNDLPFLVISAGTRNHFAMDLGLDRDHPDACLDALTDPVEICIDLGEINGRTFVNNASFGAYAEVVRSPDYRDDKRGTTLRLLPEVLSGQAGARLTAYVDGELVGREPKAVLVSNNAYLLDDLVGLGSRPRLDAGVLGVVAVSVDSAAHAVQLLHGRGGDSVLQRTAHEVVIDADTDEIPVGIDGESVMLRTPVRCTVHAHALRVRVPRTRRKVRAAEPPFDPRAVLRTAIARA